MGQMVVPADVGGVDRQHCVLQFRGRPDRVQNPQTGDAAALIRRIFSKYYLIGIGCAALGIICVGLLLADRSFGKWPAILTLLLLAGMGGTDLWLRQGVMPHMNHLRDQRAAVGEPGKPPDEELEREWKALHRLSVQMNGVVLLCGLVLVFLVVYARVV